MLFSILSILTAVVAAQFTTEVLPIDDQSITLQFKSDIPADFVDAHYFINTPMNMRSLRMVKQTEDAKTWTLPLPVLPGEQLMYKFTYQLTDGLGAKDTELMQFGEKKYNLKADQIGDRIWKVSFVPTAPDFVVDNVDLHYSTDLGATLQNIKLNKVTDTGVFESTDLTLPLAADKLQMFVTYNIGGKGVESEKLELPLLRQQAFMGAAVQPHTPVRTMFNNLQQRRDGYLNAAGEQLFNQPPTIGVQQPTTGGLPYEQRVVQDGDYLWKIEFIPQTTPQFVDVNAEVSFQGKVYQVNQKLENIGGNVWSHPPIPLGAADSVLYRFTYWLEGMDGAMESPEYIFSPEN